MDYKKINKAVRLFLEGIGEDPTREGLIETPDRVERMCKEIFSGMEETAEKHILKQFSFDDSNNDDMVVVKNIEFYSICEHHLLPFLGNVHIAYIPDGMIVGLSKICRVVEVYSKRLQLQERLTSQIADDIEKYLCPRGVMVVIEAKHTCMTMRGVKKNESLTSTVANRGCFVGNLEYQKMFMEMIKK